MKTLEEIALYRDSIVEALEAVIEESEGKLLTPITDRERHSRTREVNLLRVMLDSPYDRLTLYEQIEYLKAGLHEDVAEELEERFYAEEGDDEI